VFAGGVARALSAENLGEFHMMKDFSDEQRYDRWEEQRLNRQHRETDYSGRVLAKPTRKRPPAPKGPDKIMKSAFDNEEQYELTALSEQFVHYAMMELPPKA
jgi:hypothetical protein